MAKKKQKTLLSSLRERKRYMAFEIMSEQSLGDYSSVKEDLTAQTVQFLGEFGAAEAGVWFIDEKWNVKHQRGIMRVNNTSVDKLKTAFALVEKLNNQRVMIRSLGVSGMLNKAEQYIFAA